MRDYRRILMDNFQKVRIEGGGDYWTCGQDHDPRNWNWKPWYHLEHLCRKRGLDDFAVRDILFEHLGRKPECECQILYDERQLRTEALRGNSGLILRAGRCGWWIETELQNRFRPDFRFGFGMLTADDGMAEFLV